MVQTAEWNFRKKTCFIYKKLFLYNLVFNLIILEYSEYLFKKFIFKEGP